MSITPANSRSFRTPTDPHPHPNTLWATSLEADRAVGMTVAAELHSCMPASASAPRAEHSNGLFQNWVAVCWGLPVRQGAGSSLGASLSFGFGVPHPASWWYYPGLGPGSRPSVSLSSVPSGVTVPLQASSPLEYRERLQVWRGSREHITSSAGCLDVPGPHAYHF